jgi:RimJ/RimL family protein N-acetyltransferase
MIFREMTQADLDYMAIHGVKEKDRKIHAGQSEYNYALADGDVTLGIAGFRIINDFTAWVWMIPGDEWTQHLAVAFRLLSEWIETFCADFGIRRLEAFVEIGFNEGIRLVEHLGFIEDGIMKNFYGDLPGLRFVRLFEETK